MEKNYKIEILIERDEKMRLIDKHLRFTRKPLKLMYITNKPIVGKIAEDSSVDRIWIDLEVNGKDARQHGMNTVKSNHVISDVSIMREVLNTADLLVRVNPLFEGSKTEIDEVIARGADIVMLPMFRTADDAKGFVEMVNGRAKVLLLLETIDAVNNIESIVDVTGIDEIHIGLNDLHLEHKMRFMFELLANGTVDYISSRIASGRGIPYGFGGIARLDEGMLPARLIIAEHYRLGSSMAILSRSFYDSWIGQDVDEIRSVFQYGIKEIRDYETRLMMKDDDFFIKNHSKVQEIVHKIVEKNCISIDCEAINDNSKK